MTLKNIIKTASAAMLLLATSLPASGEQGGNFRWINPLKSGAKVHGQGWEELDTTYVRLPDKANGTVRKAVWDLSRNSAGLSLVFRSNAGEIHVRYRVKGSAGMYHFPPTGVSGVDLYAYGSDGKPLWCAPVFPAKIDKTSLYEYKELIYGNDTSREFHLLLPLYNTIEDLEIGIPAEAELTFVPKSAKRPIVVYGTSIAQGACASRPGNAWTTIVGRKLDTPVVNLGFSGNARMETELFNLLAEIDASVYVIDCLPNLNAKDDIESRVINGVRILRQRHDCPILLVEHSGTSSEFGTELRTSYKELNRKQKEAFKTLRKMGFKGIYYLSHDKIYPGMDGQVEGVHFNDMGMHRQADAVCTAIRKMHIAD